MIEWALLIGIPAFCVWHDWHYKGWPFDDDEFSALKATNVQLADALRGCITERNDARAKLDAAMKVVAVMRSWKESKVGSAQEDDAASQMFDAIEEFDVSVDGGGK